MNISHKDNGLSGGFFIEFEGQPAGELIYSWRGHDSIVIEHTQVDEVLKGKGAGKLLVEKAVEFARKQGIKVIPLCPFAKSLINKIPAYQDVL